MGYITQETGNNPIFSSYNLVDPSFNENMDSYVPKSPYQIQLEKEKQNRAKLNKTNANADAINNIPIVPGFAMNEYNQYAAMPQWMQQLNVATPDEIEQWKSMGKMGIAETWQKKKKWEMIPFAGTSAEATIAVRNANTLRKLKKGEQISDVEKDLLVDFLRDTKEIETRGGHTLAGSGLDILMSSLPYMGEFAGAIATMPEGIGFGALAETLTQMGAKKAAKIATEKALKEAAIEATMTGVKKELSTAALKEIGEKEFENVIKGGTNAALKYVSAKTALKEGVKATPKMLYTSGKASLTRMPQQFVRNTADRQLSTGVYVTDAGDATFLDSENLALSVMKALGDTTFDNLTETAGWMFAPVSSYFAKPIRNKLPETFFKAFDSLITSKYGKPAGEILHKYGYDGVVEEMGEELLNRFLVQTFGINGRDEYNLDGFLNNVLYADDPSKWASEALSFAATGAGTHAVIGSAAKAAEEFEKNKNRAEVKQLAEKANQRLYSPEQYYLDQGLVRINGSQSLAEQLLREKFTNNGIDNATSNEFFKNASELEIRNTLKNFKENENQKITSEQSQKIAELRNSLFTQGLNAGREKEVAKSESEIMTQAIVSLARITNKSIDDIESRMKLNIKSMGIEDAKSMLKGSLQYNQDAIETAGATKGHEETAQKEWKEKGIESSYFKKWFGDSKVVDSEGKPIVVYHGTNADFDSFEKNKRNLFGEGFYFTSSKDDALGYGNKTKEVYLSMKNPKYDAGVYPDVEKLKKEGYDGIVVKTPNRTNYIVFSPEQIKSIDNKGTFDAENPNIYYQSAYHGSPHKFDEFSINNIGTGEGAQSHGWGFYFANNKEVSEYYRRNLSAGKCDIKYNGRIYKSEDGNIFSLLYRLKKYGKKETINFYKGREEEFRAEGKKSSNPDWWNKEADIFKNIIDNELNKINIKNIEIDEGQLFKVDIPESKYLIDEDKYFDEQPQFIKDVLTQIEKDLSLKIGTANNLQGYSLYKSIANFVGSPRAASELLNKYGIKGITYDGRSDGRCYVVFDDKAINVLKTYYQLSDNDDIYFQEENNIDKAKGFTTQRTDFDGTVKDNLIVLLKNKADKSTLLHEFAHVYLMTLNQFARTDAKAQSQLITVNKWLRFNGVEYTRQQHEKFARGFEAYVKSGKAPSYSLKKAFENFRNWLNDVYNSVTVGNMSQDLILDDETKRVFDELLGDMTYDNQKEIANELIEKAKSNASLRLNDEYTSKHKIRPRELTDKQMRYRDTAYQILSVGLGLDKKYLQMVLGGKDKKSKSLIKQAEQIQEQIANIDDPYSAGDGFLPEWGEFFHDPGVSYDNQEVGGDYELAMAAFDVITDKRYLYSDNQLEEFSEEDVNRIKYEYEYILDSYKENKDRTTSLIAFWDWVESVPEMMQQDFLNDWELKTNEIDRYENLDKFQQAKEDLKMYAATMNGQGDYSSQFAEFARKILKRLDFMTEYDKAKIFDKLKEYNSFREVARNLDFVMDYAETLDAVTERKLLADNINKEVKQTIHEWQNGIKKTKYTYPANKLFERLRNIAKLSQEQIQDMYDAQVNDEATLSYVADEINEDDYYETIEKMYIEFRANGAYYNSAEFLTELLNRIQQAKFTAKVSRDAVDFERRMQQINLIDECGRALNLHKGKTSKLEEHYSNYFNLNSALEMMFNEGIKDKFSLDYLYAQKDAKVGKDRDEVLNKIADIFGYNGVLKNSLLFNKLIDMTKVEFSIKQRYTPDKVNGTYRVTSQDPETGKTFTEQTINIRKPGDIGYQEWEEDEVKLSRMQVLYYYIQAKNPVSYEILTNMGDESTPPKGQFDKDEFNELLSNLTPQEMLMGDILQLAAERYYPELNKYHIEKYHTELGKCIGYFPRKADAIQEKIYEPYSDYVQQVSNPKFQKQRTAGPGIRITPANPLEVLFDHMEKANTLVIMGKQLDLMNRVFNDVDLKKKVANIWGEKVQSDFYNQLAGNLFGGQASAISHAEKDCREWMNNIVKSQIFAKPQVGLKQTLAFMNYGVGDKYVSSAEWFAAFAKQTFTPLEWKKNIDYMMSNDFLRDRLFRGGSTDALKSQLETRLYAKINLLDDAFSSAIRYGDIAAIILGGKPYIDVLTKKGYTEEQAFKIFIEQTVNNQQSSIPSTLSNMQRNASKHPLTKMFFAYQNTPWQYFRTSYNSIIQFKQNPNMHTGMNAAKLCTLYLYVFPLLFNMASSLSVRTFMGSGDPEDIFKDVWRSCIGGFTFIPIVGSFINAIFIGLNGDQTSSGDWFSSAADKANRLARKTQKGELTPLDIFTAVALFGELKTGLPISSLGNAISGVGDVAQGKVEKGLLRMSGYTDYRAKRVTGEEE